MNPQTSAVEQPEAPFDQGDVSASLSGGDRSPGTEPLWRVQLLWEKRSILFRAAVVGMVLGVALAFLIPPQYEASVSLMPPESRNEGAALLLGLAAGNSALGGLAGDMFGTNRGGALFVGILRSRTVQERLVERFNLRETYGEAYLSDAVKSLDARTSITEDRKNGIITLTVRDRSALRAATLAQSYITELDRAVTEVSISSARRERLFLEERLRKVKQDLDEAAIEFSQFASRNAALDISEQGKAMMGAMAQLTGELIAAESELKGLQQIYNPNNIRVRTLQARVNELKSQVQKMGGSSQDASQSSRDAYPSLRRLPLLGVKYADLYRRTKIQETIYEILTKQYELSKVQEAKEIPTVRVLDKVRIPDRKVFPSRLLVILVATLVVILGTALFLLGKKEWEAMRPHHPWKILLGEVFQTAGTHANRLWRAGRGSARSSLSGKG